MVLRFLYSEIKVTQKREIHRVKERTKVNDMSLDTILNMSLAEHHLCVPLKDTGVSLRTGRYLSEN